MTPERATELAEAAGSTFRSSDICRTLNFIERDYGRGIRSISVWDFELPGMSEDDFIARIPIARGAGNAETPANTPNSSQSIAADDAQPSEPPQPGEG